MDFKQFLSLDWKEKKKKGLYEILQTLLPFIKFCYQWVHEICRYDPIHSDSVHVVRELSLLVNHLNSLQSSEISIDETLLYHPANETEHHRGHVKSKIDHFLSFGTSVFQDCGPQTTHIERVQERTCFLVCTGRNCYESFGAHVLKIHI